ncbi:uncharacterized protein P884DRAFT_314762 [Thermothelomyces heterothallicus CBS 202.75]|uniref:uncharacterized protein n=1 Tax=Thermothelomyces heterothallicus CBS 202.75 TaxID=1149848 RepID=UPI003742E1B1
MAEDEITVLPERIDIVVQRVTRGGYGSLANSLLMMLRRSQLDNGDFDLAVDEDRTRDNLRTLDLEGFVSITTREGTVIVSMPQAASPSEAQLVYLVYPTFLAGIPDSCRAASLKTTAEVFTAALVEELGRSITIYLEFRLPTHGADLSSLISEHRAQLAASDGNGGTRGRVHSCTRYAQDPSDTRTEPYPTFLVVLDKPDFLQNQGVLFVMTDGGRVKPLPFTDEEGNPMPNPYPGMVDQECDYEETLVLPSVGMHETSRRLTMLGLDSGV